MLFGPMTVRGESRARCARDGRGGGRWSPTSSECSSSSRYSSERSEQSAATLSGGEQQMLAVGRALMAAPAPSAARRAVTGPSARRSSKRSLSALDKLKEEGMTILLVEQDARLALKHADRGYVMRTGAIALAGQRRRTARRRRCQAHLPRCLARGRGELVIWNPEYESMARAELEELQLRRLAVHRRLGVRAGTVLPSALDERGVKPKDIRTLDDVARLPFTDKTALRDTYPFGLFAVPIDQVPSAYTPRPERPAKPIVVGYTKGDIATWTELTARVSSAAGVASHRPGADGLRLRHVHGRVRDALRSRASGRDGHPRERGQHRAPPHDDGRLRHDRAHLHAVIRALPGRGGRRARP
jgi:hypothetical protein